MDADKRALDFRREWDALTPEEKKNALGAAKCGLNQLLTFYDAVSSREEFHVSYPDMPDNEKDRRRALEQQFIRQSFQVAIEAITEIIERDLSGGSP